MKYKDEDGEVFDLSRAYDVAVLNRVIFDEIGYKMYSNNIYKLFYCAKNKEYRNVKIVKETKTDDRYKVEFEVYYSKQGFTAKYTFYAPSSLWSLDYSDYSTMFVLGFCNFDKTQFLPYLINDNSQELEKLGLLRTRTVKPNDCYDETTLQDKK